MTEDERRGKLVSPARRVLGLLLLAAAGLGAAGCGGALVGTWRMVSASPSKEVFAIDDATFSRDGGFRATCTIDGKTFDEVGTYSFDGFKLRLRPQAGGQRVYTATRTFSKLEIVNGESRVVLKKE